MKLEKILVVLSAACLSAACPGVEYFVDAAHVGSAGRGGRTQADAFGTIQEAVDVAATNGVSGDVITVLPGRYDAGYGTWKMTDSKKGECEYTNRVLIAESDLTLRSSGGAAATVIAGRHDAVNGANYCGMGMQAISCVMVQGKRTNVRLIGFTLADGAAQRWNDGSGDILPGSGGAACTDNTAASLRLVDCIITNCAGARAGALRRCTAVRCEIVGCRGQAGAAVARDAQLLHCYIHGNRFTDGCTLNSTLVNCSIVGNPGPSSVFSQQNAVYNTLVLYNAGALPFTTGTQTTNYALVNSLVATLSKDSVIATIQDSVTNPAPFQCLAPALADYRPIRASEAATCGEAAHVARIEGLSDDDRPYVSFDGRELAASGACAAGAFQETAVPAGGAHLFAKAVCANGFLGVTKDLYAFSETDKAVFRATKDPAAKDLVFVQQTYAGGDPRLIYPEMDDSVYFMMPPAGIVVTNAFAYAETGSGKTLYVNPVTGVDDTASGRGSSADKPYRTLQYAVDKVPTGSGSYSIVHAAAGDYAEGGTLAVNWPTRLSVRDRFVRVKGAGRETTFLRGTTNHADEDAYGRGTNAVKCLYGKDSACVQGFTLVDGRCDSGTDFGGRYCGGLFHSDSASFTLADCALTGGSAFRGSIAFGCGKIIRCVITNNVIFSGGGIRWPTTLESCLLYDNPTAESSAYLTEGPTRDCTFVALANTGSNRLWLNNGNVACLVDSILWGNKTLSYAILSDAMTGCVIGNNTDTAAALNTDPAFVNAADLDFRVFAHSPALTAAEVRDDEWLQSLTDVTGRPRRFFAGRPIAGALHDTPLRLEVTVPDATSLAQGTAGAHVVEAGDSYTITCASYAAGAGKRPVIGFTVDGEDAPATGLSYTYAFPADYGASPYAAPVALKPVVETNLYVDVACGNDANDGFAPGADRAFHSLTGAMAVAVRGDTVHVAPGTYAEGSAVLENGSRTSRVRVRVPGGVTYVSDAGAEKTVILGAASADPAADACGRGTNAVRCARVDDGGTLDGFTLTGGRTGNLMNTDDGDAVGGGVSCANSQLALVRNCIISNNFARRGGGGAYGRYVNCRILGNCADTTSSGLYHGYGFGCLLDGNYGCAQVWRLYDAIESRTVTAGNFGDAAKTKQASLTIDDSPTKQIVNSVILGMTDKSEALTAANTIFVTGYVTNLSKHADCTYVAKDAAVLDADFAPVKGGAALDALDTTEAPAVSGGRDLYGNPRVLNGAMDLGAVEYDWRTDYAADLGGSLTVTEASPKTVETTGEDGKSVTLRAGALAMTIGAPGGATKNRFTLPFEVLGDGTLTVIVNGTTTNAFTRADGPATLVFSNNLAENRVVYGYDADDAGVSLAALTRRSLGFMLIVR